jgi:hypothetical protein
MFKNERVEDTINQEESKKESFFFLVVQKRDRVTAKNRNNK